MDGYFQGFMIVHDPFALGWHHTWHAAQAHTLVPGHAAKAHTLVPGHAAKAHTHTHTHRYQSMRQRHTHWYQGIQLPKGLPASSCGTAAASRAGAPAQRSLAFAAAVPTLASPCPAVPVPDAPAKQSKRRPSHLPMLGCSSGRHVPHRSQPWTIHATTVDMALAAQQFRCSSCRRVSHMFQPCAT